MMAQMAAALIAFSLRDETFDKIVYLMNIESSKFRKPVFPNQIIKANVGQLDQKEEYGDLKVKQLMKKMK